MYNNYKAWRDAAFVAGFAIENDGSGKIVAHRDGAEQGIWDPAYGGAGCGWFNEKTV